jgi:DNA-binding transcriptional regulator YiaG
MSWQKQREMTPKQYKATIKMLGMSQAASGRFLGVSERTAHRYVSGDAAVPISAALLLRSLIHHGEVPVVPEWTGK